MCAYGGVRVCCTVPTSTAASAKFSYHFLLETLGSPSFFSSFLLTGIVLEAQGGAREPLPPWVYCTGTAEGSAFLMNKYRVHSITSRQLLS